MTLKRNATVYLVLSVIGALFISAIAWLGHLEDGPVDALDRSIVLGALLLSCLFGISLAIRPGWIRRSIGGASHATGSEERTGPQRELEGHHPNCEGFRHHVVKLGGRTLCAGCSGLAVGSVISILAAIPLILLPIDIPTGFLYSALLLGIFFVALNFAEIGVSPKKAIIHMASNVLLVVGFLLVVSSIFLLTGSSAYGLLTVIISFLWLDTRIQLSRWRHAGTCQSCVEHCKAY